MRGWSHGHRTQVSAGSVSGGGCRMSSAVDYVGEWTINPPDSHSGWTRNRGQARISARSPEVGSNLPARARVAGRRLRC